MLSCCISERKSIRSKILTLIIGITALSLITANIIELGSEYMSSRLRTKVHLQTVTDIAQNNINNYIKAEEHHKIPDFMLSFEFDPYIDQACYYTKGELAAAFVSPKGIEEYGQNALCPPKAPPASTYQNDLTHIYDLVDIIDRAGQATGMLLIKYDLERDLIYLAQKEVISIIIFFLAILFTYILATKLQLILTKPIFHLAGVAAALTEEEDYTLRATKFNDDEIGLLAETFNAMIETMGEKNTALREAQINAERITVMKSEFLATMSHEIRTPMNGIIGMADLLEETPLNTKQKHYTSVIIKSANTLLDLINDILDFSKIEAGKLELEQVDFDITQTIEDVIDMLEYSVRQKGLDFQFINNLTARHIVIGDPVRLKQVLINLTSNAIKFTESGHIIITLEEGVQRDDAFKEIWFSVSDSGIGIPPDRQTTIFDSFSQADTSTTRRFGGSGLGLSICKKLVTLMDGTIGVQSAADIGSTFWFSLPLRIADVKNETIKTQKDHQTLENRAEGSILLVEDNQTNVMIAEEILRGAGYNVVTCLNGHHAVETYKKAPFKTILMDCHMPIMDGFEATEEIRRFELQNNIPPARIIALTASAQTSDHKKCMDVGMDDFLSKPFRKHDLLHKVLSG